LRKTLTQNVREFSEPASFDAAPALAVPGVRHVLEVSVAVAVVADDTWTAIRGRQALAVA
jgi:isoquinoline 1-oxidoreductase beta subunit